MDKIKLLFSKLIKLGKYEANGIVLVYEGELGIGTEVFVEEGNDMIPAPDGTYGEYTVIGGRIAEPEKVEEEIKASEDESLRMENDSLKSEIETLKAEIARLTEELEAAKAEKEEVALSQIKTVEEIVDDTNSEADIIKKYNLNKKFN